MTNCEFLCRDRPKDDNSRLQRPWAARVDTFRIHCDKHDDGEGEYHEPDEGLGDGGLCLLSTAATATTTTQPH